VPKGVCDVHGVPVLGGIGHGLRRLFGGRSSEAPAEEVDAPEL
jgi:hypothetical protein